MSMCISICNNLDVDYCNADILARCMVLSMFYILVSLLGYVLRYSYLFNVQYIILIMSSFCLSIAIAT